MVSRLNYIHNFRALAILFIVSGHAIDIFKWPDYSSLEKILRIFISNGSALFVFIAGYLFQHLIKKFDARKYYLNKFTNVIIPYLIISIPAILLFVLFMKRPGMPEDFYQKSVFEQIASFIMNGSHLAPFWFIPMISIFYLVAIPLRKFDEYKAFYMLIPVFIIISCIVPRGAPYQSFIHFFSIYVIGMFCSHYKDVLNVHFSNAFNLFIMALAVFTFGCLEYVFMTGTMTWLNVLQKIFMSIFFLGFLYRLNDNLNYPFVSKVADYSFGIFFLHSYIISSGKVLYANFAGEAISFNFITYFVSIIITFAICLVLVELIKFIFKGKSKYFVGS